MKKKFYWRSYVSISLLLSFLVIAVSGVILYLAPPGRVARWISWVMLGFNRGQWEDLHTLFSYLFIIFGLFHLFLFNWKLFFSYLRSRITRKINRKREIIFALATFLAIALFTLAKWPPVYSVMDLGNTISSGWAERRGAPPVPHAEEMTINDIVERVVQVRAGIGYREVAGTWLCGQGWKPDPRFFGRTERNISFRVVQTAIRIFHCYLSRLRGRNY
jgi:hypothetical protein